MCSAGYLVASTIDEFEKDGTIVVEDTPLNHPPEVLEFGLQPEVAGSTANGSYQYLLAGSSGLTGDVFGLYRFDGPLEVGKMVKFMGVGSYAQAKSDRFNGINLPAASVATLDGLLTQR